MDFPHRTPLFSIRAKMLSRFGGLFALVLLALLLVRLYGIPFTEVDGAYQEKQRAVLLNLDLVAEIKKELISQWLAERRADLRLLAESEELARDFAQAVRDGNDRPLVRPLQRLKGKHPAYISVSVVDAHSARILESTDEREAGAPVSRDLFYSKAVTAGYREVVDTARSPVTRRFQLTISQQILLPGQSGVSGLLVARIDPDRLVASLLNSGDEGLGSSGEVVLVNQDLKVLNTLKYSLPDGSAARPMEYQDRARSSAFAAAGSEGMLLDTDYRGVPVLAAYRHVRISPEQGWGLVVKRDRDEVFAPVRRSLIQAALLSAFGLGLALVLALLVARRLSRPIHELSDTARRVQAGDLGARAPVRAADEVGLLAAAFNAMVDRIQDWHGALEAQVRERTEALSSAYGSLKQEVGQREQAELGLLRLNRLYATLSQTNQMIVRATDVEELFQAACRIAVEEGRLGTAWIAEFDEASGHLQPAGWYGAMDESLEAVLADGAGGETLQALMAAGQSRVYAELADEAASMGWMRHALAAGFHSAACFPLQRSGRSFGVFVFCAEEAGFFDEAEVRLLEEMAVDVSFAVETIDREQQRKRAEESLRKLSHAVEQSPASVVITDVNGNIEYVNPKFARVTGYEPQEVIGLNPRFLKSGRTAPAEYRRLWQTITAGGEWTGELQNRRKNDELYWESASISPIRNADGEITHFIAVKEDITRRKQAEETLRDSDERMRGIASAAMDAIMTMDTAGRITYWNPAAEAIFGYSAEEALGQQLHALVAPRSLAVEHGRGFPGFKRSGEGAIVRRIVEMTALRRGGEEFPVELSVSPVRIKEQWHAVGIIRDITERKRAEQVLQHSAFHDALTDLPNRALFLDRLGLAMARAARDPSYLFGVLFLDLDRFKNVNDGLGHLAGDRLLVEVAHLLSGCVRPGDTVARIGGDEFAILAEPIKDATDAIHVAERVHEVLRRPITAAGHEVFTSASIGITLSSPDYDGPEEVLRDADTAMYRAKAQGKARYQVFNSDMHANALALLRLETELRHGIERDEFELHYQPIVSLRDGSVRGFEALVRWRHPRRGLVGPGEFIQLAEETGLISAIGCKVLHQACRRMGEWRRQWPNKPLYVSVNLSPKQFLQPDLVEQVDGILGETGVDPRDLRLEITETAMMENAEAVAATLLKFKERGIRLYIDDFGTGYSSLSYLHQLPFDTLKIDRSFVSGLGEGGSQGIVPTVIGLARGFGMDVIAEGVETEAQARRLRELNCENVQGFLFSRALPPEEAAALIDRRFAEALALS